ncbi:MAG: NAD(P)/FAD-dependent oxidoreductase, partial [Desulfovibrionaceae bacterium]|nr:NAD(P)/FAD-dependent oxidoreductase [Desulfovibrionaceae bacterium]
MSRVVIIGAGPGGYTAALRAARLGESVTLIDSAEPGGTCLARGCIPSKIMRHAADFAEAREKAAAYGIDFGSHEYSVDLPTLRARQKTIVEGMQKGLTATFKNSGIEFIRGSARLAPGGVVEIKCGEECLTRGYDQLLLAIGSRPADIPGAPPELQIDGDKIISSNEALSLTELPDGLLVVGGGVIGCELAQIYHALGVKVTLVEAMDRILPLPSLDEDICKSYMRCLKKARLPFYTGYSLSAAERTDAGLKAVLTPWQREGEAKEIVCSKILVCTGRAPLPDTLGLAEAGVLFTSRGWIEVDACFRTATPNIWAIGDCLGPAYGMLAHTAQAQGMAAVEAMLGKTPSMNMKHVPATIFSRPEIACVGLSLRQAAEEIPGSQASDFLFRQLGKAQATGEIDGQVRIVYAPDRKVLGGQILGANASALIGEIALAASAGLSIDDIAAAIHAHPSLPEG